MWLYRGGFACSPHQRAIRNVRRRVLSAEAVRRGFEGFNILETLDLEVEGFIAEGVPVARIRDPADVCVTASSALSGQSCLSLHYMKVQPSIALSQNSLGADVQYL